MPRRRRPGEIRDAIRIFLATTEQGANISEIQAAVEAQFREGVAPSSIRSSLNLGVGDLYERIGRGRYRLRGK